MEQMKENVLIDFKKMIKQLWTYDRLTIEERDRLFKCFESIQTKEALKGTYQQRWEILQSIYSAFLLGVGYDSFNWRDQ